MSDSLSLSHEELRGDVESIKELLRAYPSEAIEGYASMKVLHAAIMSGRFSDDGADDRACSACRAVLNERGEEWRYQRAWNAAYRSQGHQPSEADIAAARRPVVESSGIDL